MTIYQNNSVKLTEGFALERKFEICAKMQAQTIYMVYKEFHSFH